VTVLAVSGLTASIGGTAVLTDGDGVLVVLPSGVAGYVSGKATAGLGCRCGRRRHGAPPGQDRDGRRREQVVTVGGREVPISFPGTGTVFELSLTGAQLVIGDVVFVEGDVSLTGDTFAGRNLTVFVGAGPLFLADGARNPLARGVLITGATVGIVRSGTAWSAVVRGVVELLGFPGVTLSGTVSVAVSTGAVAAQTLTFPDGSGSLVVDVASGTRSVTGLGLAIGVQGQTLTGDLTIALAADGGMTATVANLELVLRDGATALGSLTAGAGELRFTSVGVVGAVSGTLTLTVPGVTLSSSVRLAVNTTAAAVTGTFGGPSTTIPAGPYLKLVAGSTTLRLAGVQLTAQTFEVERSTVGGSPVTRITVTGGTVRLRDGAADTGTELLSLTDVAGSFTLSAAGVAGRLSATAGTTPSFVRLSSVSLAGEHRDRDRRRPAGGAVPAGRGAGRRPGPGQRRQRPRRPVVRADHHGGRSEHGGRRHQRRHLQRAGRRLAPGAARGRLRRGAAVRHRRVGRRAARQRRPLRARGQPHRRAGARAQQPRH
jgi:hypothetical protein